MRQTGAYTDKDEDGEDQFWAVLECGCTIHVPLASLAETDLPCPLHEEYRFMGTSRRTSLCNLAS